ncbi:MAG: sulfite exporter TauE/SafE family protein [Candidatus Omnitrophota bacterium]
MKNLKYIVLGFFAGFSSAFLGVGGGVVMVPALVFFFGYAMQKAAGTSLATIVPAAFVGALTHYLIKSGNIHFISVLYIVLGAVAGSRIGSILANKANNRVLKILFAFFLIFIGVRQAGIVNFQITAAMNLASIPSFVILGFAAGLVSALFGIGGGVIMVPVLNIFFGFPMHEAIATSITVIVPTAAAGAFFHSEFGNIDREAVKCLIPGAMVGAILGAVLSNMTDPGALKIILGGVILLCAVKMFFKTE